MKEDKLLKKRKKLILEIVNDPIYKPMTFEKLSKLLMVSQKGKKELLEILIILEKEGKVKKDKANRYRKVKKNEKSKKPSFETKEEGIKKKKQNHKENLLEGKFIGNKRGFGFVEIADRDEDIFVPESFVNGALNEDTVLVEITNDKVENGRTEGRIVEIVNRGVTEIVGTIQLNKSFGFVISDNPKFTKDVFISPNNLKGLNNGDKVVVKITDYGDERRKPEGKIVENLGSLSTPGTDILAIIKSFGVPYEFPPKVENARKKVPKSINEGDFAGRVDLRDKVTVTIDGDDAKDLDDAISLEKTENGYILGVHIADVSNYVQEGSAFDREALKRGTSVYLPDRVVPMLPEELSNGICSLNAGEDRLALSCIMEICKDGRCMNSTIAETIIHVNKRMSYNKVKAVCEGEIAEDYKDYEDLIKTMKELSLIIRENRTKRGAIDFEFPESKIKLNEKGFPISIEPYNSNVATKIIEDFMLMANETVARYFSEHNIPFVYRTHENPDSDKIEELLTFIRKMGIKANKKGLELTNLELQKIMDNIKGTQRQELLNRLILRSMKQAKYTVEDIGHFGLAAKYYCHFTSPIRRYPDLQIHRIIKDYLRKRINKNDRIEHYKNILPEVASHCSVTERRAVDTEREAVKLKMAEYMSKRIFEEFDGTISGVTKAGFYVELDNTVEGFVAARTINTDYYVFEEESKELVGEKTGKTYSMGDKVKIKVMAVDLYLRTIDFALA